ncbi:Glycinol 4-dimethylallyltransferase [Glycine soja]
MRGNLWRRKHSTSNINYPGSCSSKASQNKRKIQMEYNLLRFQQSSLNHHYKCIEGGSAYQEWNKKYVVKATSKPSFDSGLPTSNSKNMLDSALVPYTFLDVYINGLNQLSDIEIDKINKPYLPLASGQLSFRTEFLAWLDYRFLATDLESCNVFFTMDRLFNQRTVVEMEETSTTCSNDIPDIEGDKKYGIHSFSARLGQKRGLGHAALGSVLRYQAKYVDLTNKVSIRSFYMLIWKLTLLLILCISSVTLKLAQDKKKQTNKKTQQTSTAEQDPKIYVVWQCAYIHGKM